MFFIIPLFNIAQDYINIENGYLNTVKNKAQKKEFELSIFPHVDLTAYADKSQSFPWAMEKLIKRVIEYEASSKQPIITMEKALWSNSPEFLSDQVISFPCFHVFLHDLHVLVLADLYYM